MDKSPTDLCPPRNRLNTPDLMQQPTAEEFRRWLQLTGLSPEQVAQLAHVKVDVGVGSDGARSGKGPRTTQARAVGHWKNGSRRVPLATWQLIRAKHLLLHLQVASFEELISQPLETILWRLIWRLVTKREPDLLLRKLLQDPLLHRLFHAP